MATLSLLQIHTISIKVNKCIDNLFSECHKECHTENEDSSINLDEIEIDVLKDIIKKTITNQIESRL
jgi:hypothetical protein